MIPLFFVLVTGISCVNTLILDEQTENSVLQLMVRLEADVNANKAQLKELLESCPCAGAAKKQTPSFMAALGHTITGCMAEHPIIFDTVKLNQRSVYDNRHGTFRAPVNGTYHFSATLSAPPNDNGFHVAFVKNLASNQVGYLYADSHVNHWQEKTTSLVMHLSAGDDIWLTCLGDSEIHGNIGGRATDYHSHFSGFLVAED